MSNLILCPIKMASQPFHLKSIDLHFYSLEELLYYYKKHEILIDKSIMSQEFIFWIRQQEQNVLADKLSQIVSGKGTLAMFMAVLIDAVNTFDEEEKAQFLSHLEKLENKNELERRKVLADQMLSREKYEAAILEYCRILDSSLTEVGEEEFLGNIWHNLGCCYSNLFLFEQAIDAFKKAYGYHPNEDTKKAVDFCMEAKEQVDSFMNFPGKSDVTLQQREDNHQFDKEILQRKEEYLNSTL